MPQIVLHDKTNNTESDVESSDVSVARWNLFVRMNPCTMIQKVR